jgi:selenophosphate synthetase-related protein
VLSVEPNQVERVLSLANDAGVPAAQIGTVGGHRFVMQIEGDKSAAGCTIDLELTTLYEQWAMAIPRALGQD